MKYWNQFDANPNPTPAKKSKSNHIHPCWQPKSSIVLPLNPTSVLTNISIMKYVSPSTPPLTPVDDDESERRTVMVSSHLFDVHMVSFVSLVLISSIFYLSRHLSKSVNHTHCQTKKHGQIGPWWYVKIHLSLLSLNQNMVLHLILSGYPSWVIYIECISLHIFFGITKTHSYLCRNYRRTYLRVQW